MVLRRSIDHVHMKIIKIEASSLVGNIMTWEVPQFEKQPHLWPVVYHVYLCMMCKPGLKGSSRPCPSARMALWAPRCFAVHQDIVAAKDGCHHLGIVNPSDVTRNFSNCWKYVCIEDWIHWVIEYMWNRTVHMITETMSHWLAPREEKGLLCDHLQESSGHPLIKARGACLTRYLGASMLHLQPYRIMWCRY